MPKITLRNQRLSDARVFYDILTNPNFLYFVKVESLEAQKDFLKKNKEKRKTNYEYNFTILYNKKIVGGCGIKVNQHRKYIGEIGYFIDESYWGKGIATKSVKLLEEFATKKLKMTRIEILMNPKNKASEKVAIKAGYKKEGKMLKVLNENNKKVDAYLYTKIFKD